MKFIAIAAPLFLLAACSEPVATAPEPAPMSAEARDTMERVNNSNFSTLTEVPAVPGAAVPPQAVPDTEAASGSAPVEASAEPQLPEATVATNVRYNAALVRIQTLLDRAHFSPGVIDGYDGSNVRKAVSAYQEAKGMTVNGLADDALLEALAVADTAPALVAYTLTAEDVAGPFAEVPNDLEAMSELSRIGYETAAEAMAEKFHMDVDLLRTLNPGVDFAQAGTEIVVANAGGELDVEVASILVDKNAGALRAFDAQGQLVAFYPASIGSREAPAPTGEYTVRSITFDPTYHYDPARLPTFGRRPHGALDIAAGPNNPVGAVWIALSLDTYGIHGAAEPAQVSKTQSHGCIRLTNWDATELGRASRAGVPVALRNNLQLAERMGRTG